MDANISNLPIIIAVMVISLGFHEAMHAFVAYKLGDDTAYDMGRVTLNPLKHIDLFTTILLPVGLILLGLPPFFVAKPVPFNPDRVKYDEFGAAMVGLAGPLTNLALAIIGAGLLRLLAPEPASGLVNILLIFVQINLSYFIFNMIPFPPLDGSRLVYAFAPEPLQRFMYQIESLGFTAILIFMFLLFPLLAPFVVDANDTLLRMLL